MSSETINIVLNLSTNGEILSFSVQTIDNCIGLTKVNSHSDSLESCPKCTCRISVFTSELKSETLSEKEYVLDETKHENSISSDDDKPLPVSFSFSMEAESESSKPKRTKTSPKKKPKRKPSLPQSYHHPAYKVSPLRCLHCGLIFGNEFLVENHQKRFGVEGGKTEPVPDAVKCSDHCKRFFANDEDLKRHLNEARTREKKCKHCSEVFHSNRKLQQHQLAHFGSIDCRKCQLSFSDTKSFDKHLLTHLKVDAPRCRFCNRAFTSEDQLALHIRWVHDKNTACSFCDKNFASLISLREHENLHQNITPYQCDLCGTSFFRSMDFSRHMESHKGRVVCDLCNQSYKTKLYLKRHMIGTHMEPQEIFECTVCPAPKRFRTKYLLQIHQKIHKNERNMPCPTCGKLFPTHQKVKKHIEAMHTDLSQRRKFECEICGKILFHRSALKNHINMHKNVDKYKCKHCGKVLTNPANLRRHEGIHTDERPFTCQTCGKSFRHAMDLKVHTRLHTGEKPYECPVEECKKRFSDRGCFRGHLLNHEKQLNIKLIKKKNYLNDS